MRSRHVFVLGFVAVTGCADVGSNDVVYRTRDGMTEQVGQGCLLVQDGNPEGDRGVLVAPDDEGFSTATRSIAGMVEYGYFVDGIAVLEERFSVDDLQRPEPLRREFEDGEDHYEVVFWSTPDCDTGERVPDPS